jgi:hypothetical protein
MKNKLRFTVFLTSRFKGLVLYAIGIAIYIYLTIQSIAVPARDINFGVTILMSVIALVLMAIGSMLRRKPKKS